MNPPPDARDGVERKRALQRIDARHAELDRRIAELRTLVLEPSGAGSPPLTIERVLRLLRQAVDDLAADSLDLHRQVGELRRRLDPDAGTPRWDLHLGRALRSAAARGLSIARRVRRVLLRAARGATGEEAIRRLSGRLPNVPVPALAVVLPEAGAGDGSGRSAEAAETVPGVRTLAASGLVEWVRVEAAGARIESPSTGELREVERSAISAALRSPYVLAAGFGSEGLPAVSFELAVLELLLEDLLFVRLEGGDEGSRAEGEREPDGAGRNAGGAWIVRREVWCAQRGIDWGRLARLAERDRRWVLGKALLPVGSRAGLPIGGESRGNPSLPTCWRKDGYLVRRGSAVKPLAVVEPSSHLEPPAVAADDPMTILCVPFIGDTEVDELLGQLMVKLGGHCRFAIATLAPQPRAMARMVEALRSVTPWLLPLGEQQPLELRGVRLSYFVKRLAAETVVWVHGEEDQQPGGTEAGALRELFTGLSARHPDLRLACLATSREAARKVEAWSLFREVALLGEGVPAGIDPALFEPGRLSAEERQRLRRELGADDEKVLVLMAAALEPAQRPEDFLGLAQRLESDPRFVFVLAGEGPLGAATDDLLRFMGLHNLRRLPSVLDRVTLVAAADVVVSPAERDPAPLTILGALAMERPVVISSASSLAGLVRETGCGQVVDGVGDLRGLARAVESLGARGARDSVGRRGSRAVSDRFTLTASAEAFARFAGLRRRTVAEVS